MPYGKIFVAPSLCKKHRKMKTVFVQGYYRGKKGFRILVKTHWRCSPSR
jgi:hypothetical protein